MKKENLNVSQKPLKTKIVTKTFNQRLFDLQKDLDAISKDTTNPFFNSKYFDINALINHLKPLLNKHELLLHQPIVEGNVLSRISCVSTGEFIDSEIALPNIDNPQKVGSAISYYRRYTLASLIALQSQDDDAQMTNPSNESRDELPWLNLGTKEYDNALNGLKNGKTISDIRQHYKVSKQVHEQLILT
jgi:hypothetical protein